MMKYFIKSICFEKLTFNTHVFDVHLAGWESLRSIFPDPLYALPGTHSCLVLSRRVTGLKSEQHVTHLCGAKSKRKLNLDTSTP